MDVLVQNVWLTRSPGALWRRSGAEVLVTRQGLDRVERLNTTAAAIWDRLAEPTTPEELLERLAGEYGRDAERIAPEVGELLADLVARGLVDAVADADD